jgi:hypothetical protein
MRVPSRWQTIWTIVRGADRPGRVVRLATAGPDVIVSADDSGTLEARRIGDGAVAGRPVRTRRHDIVALVGWRDGIGVRAATGAGSRRSPHPWLQRWNLSTGEELLPASRMETPRLKDVATATVQGEVALVVVNRTLLEIRRTADGVVRRLVRKHDGTFRLVTGRSGGRPIAVVSALDRHPEVFQLEDLAAPPVPVPGLDGGFVIAVHGDHLVTGSLAEPYDAWRTVWARDLSGGPAGPPVTGAPVTAVAVAAWPAVYIARIDGTVSLVDLASGAEVCPALRLPDPAAGIAVAADGDLVAGFGAEVARFHPPAGLAAGPSAGPEFFSGPADGR